MAKLNLENATIDELRQSLLAGSISAAALVEAYLARIEILRPRRSAYSPRSARSTPTP